MRTRNLIGLFVVVCCWGLVLVVDQGLATPQPAPRAASPAHSVFGWDPRFADPYPEMLDLKVGYLPATHDALLFIALELKLFEASGVNVVPALYKNSPAALNALEAGDVDVAIPGIAAPIYRIASGTDLRIVGGEAWFSAAIVAPSQLTIAPEASPVEILSLFKKKRIATVNQSTGDAILRAFLVDNDLARDVELAIYETPDKAIEALKAREVDAAMLWSPHMTRAEVDTKGDLRTILWASQLQSHPCCRQVATARVSEEKSEAITRYLAGLILAKRFMLDPANKDAVLKAVGRYVNNPPEILERELFQIAEPVKHRWTEVSPNASPTEVSTYADMMRKAKLISANGVRRVESATDTSPLAEAYRRVFPELTADEAKACASAGLDFDPRLKTLRPVMRVKN